MNKYSIRGVIDMVTKEKKVQTPVWRKKQTLGTKVMRFLRKNTLLAIAFMVFTTCAIINVMLIYRFVDIVKVL